jgi:anti-repressor protein
MSEKQALILVKNIDGKPLASSRTIAHVFGKRHDNVLEKIRNMKMSNDFRLLNFKEGTYRDDNGDEQPRFLMTRDGCSMIIMSFTGEKAMEWKEKFIAAFNAMEKELLKLQERENPKTFAESLRMLADEWEKNQLLESKIEADKPKVEFAEHMEQTDGVISISEFAKMLSKNGYKTGQKRLFQKFRDKGWIVLNKRGVNEPRQRVMEYGWFEYNEFTKQVPINNGQETRTQLCSKIMVTGKGQVSITKILLRELEK